MKVMNNKNMMNYISAANQTDFEYNFLIFQTDDLSVYINREKSYPVILCWGWVRVLAELSLST